MLKTLFSNPITRTFIALIIAIMAVLGAFFTYVTAPESFGKTDIKFTTETIYYFADDWSLAYDYLDFKFASGTLVIPAYYQGRVVAVLLIPPEGYPGIIGISLPQEFRGDLPERIEDNLDQALIMLDYLDYKNIIQDSGDTILLRAEDLTERDIPKKYLSRQLQNGYNLLSSYDIYGFSNWLLPTPQTVLLSLWGQRLGAFDYYEDYQVSISGADLDISFIHPELSTQYYPPEDYIPRIAVYMLFLSLAAVALIALIAGGLDHRKRDVSGEYQVVWISVALFGALVYAWMLTNFEMYFQPPLFGLAALWLLPLLLIATWAYKSRLGPDFFGITSRGLVEGLVAAISVSVFISLGATFALPAGIDWNTSLVISIILVVMFREALLRGFCQRILSHWLHPLVGIITVSCAWGLTVFFTDSIGVGLLPLLSALGPSLLVGFLYYRTDNLIAAGLLAALLELAPILLKH